MGQVKRKKVPSVLIACEGDGDKEFVQFVMSFWYPRNSGHRIMVKSFHGGDPNRVVKKAPQYPIDISRWYLFLDQFTIAKKNFRTPKSVYVITSDPCLEAMICRILGSEKAFGGMSEKDCKRHLREKYGCDRITKKWLKQHITEEMLEERRGSILALSELWEILRGSEDGC